MDKRNEIVENIKEIGQSLIDNAEDIVGNCEYLRSLTITCYPMEGNEAPYYSIDRDIIAGRMNK